MELENAERRLPAAPAPAGLPTQWLLGVLGRLRHGRLTVHAPGGSHLVLGDRSGPAASLSVRRPWRLAARLLGRGDLGLAEGFIAGDWDAPHPAQVLEVLALNEPHLLSSGAGRLSRWIDRLQHRRRRNDRRGSRRNIAFHYDLGNDFYRLWLDPGMTYSSALFDGVPGRTLEQAQEAKYRRMLDELSLPAGASVLEIGCGWGAFAELAVGDGLRVKGLTLSTEQLAWARDRLAATEAGRLARFELQDYRDERERHDGIVSIEMFEAVGEAYWPRYFETVARSLAPGGRAVIQTITIDEALFDRYRRGTDFIQQYVFPGGMLPSASAFEAAAKRAGLRVARRFAFGRDYARTLQLWREAFCASLPEVRAQGFDDRFVRTWLFYLAYCEAAFRAGNTDVVQFTLERA